MDLLRAYLENSTNRRVSARGLQKTATNAPACRPGALTGLIPKHFVKILALVATLAASVESGRAAPASTDSARGTLTNTDLAAEFKKIEAADDAAQAEVDRWTRENNEAKAKGAGLSVSEMDQRVEQRFEPVRLAYEDFLRKHPVDAHAHLVYGSFLNSRQDEAGAQAHWEKALALDPKDAAVYNNLAGRYSETGPVNKAFEYFAKAIELNPTEPVYYHNFADSLYVLRKPAASFYGTTEQGVYAKAMLLYSNALRLDPQNFAFARDWAQTYYVLKPLPIEQALNAWSNAVNTASEEADKQDACVHLARVKMLAGRFAEARSQLDGVTNEAVLKAKTTLLRSITEREKENLGR